MVHCNNGTSDLDAWVKLFGETAALVGANPSKAELYDALYGAALEGEADGGGLAVCNYLSGEHITGFAEGRPLLVRTPDSRFTPANLLRSLLMSSLATLRIGMDILAGEGVKIDRLLGHGGLFKTKVVGQKLMAGALRIPVAVMESAGEGGAWGIALLAAYAICKREDEDLEDYLADKVFAGLAADCVQPNAADAAGFERYMERYKALLKVERKAVEAVR
jgi:sugar (pentulose or hexulose) kinase